MDQAALSAIGNAYADEILFAARIHPKTSCSSLSAEQRRALYESIRSVMAWGIAEVEKAAQPIEVKVRDHVKVRNRKDEPCPVCGTKIRRVGVLGYDSFFCPQCQAASQTPEDPMVKSRSLLICLAAYCRRGRWPPSPCAGSPRACRRCGRRAWPTWRQPSWSFRLQPRP